MSPRARPLRRPRAIAGEPIVHVGYHKTASTWLQFCVFPFLEGIRYGEPRLRRFVNDLSTATDESFRAADFLRAFRLIERQPGGPLLLSTEGISGSLWDGYGTGLRNAERLHGVLPRARVLLVVRRQDEMLRSVHGQYVNEGGTRALRDFVEGRGVEGSRFSLRHLEYHRLVGRYVELFGRERVWVAPYEYLRARRRRFLEDLCAFIGARLTTGLSSARPNRTLSRPSLRLLRAWNRLFRATRFNADPLVAALPGGRRIRNLLHRRVDPLLRPLAWDPAGRRDAAWLAALAARFAGSNQRLQRVCPYPLAEWGYPLPAGALPRASGASVSPTEHTTTLPRDARPPHLSPGPGGWKS